MTATNPPWADAIYRKFRDKIQERANERKLPVPVSTPGGIPLGELGCGHYGCVFGSTDPNVVFKITTDESEAFFIALTQKWIKAGWDYPQGIVRYYAIYALPEASHKKRKVFVLWREAAHDIGMNNYRKPILARIPDTGPGYIRNFEALIRHWLMAGRELRTIILRKGKVGEPQYREWLKRQVRLAFDDNDDFQETYYGLDHPLAMEGGIASVRRYRGSDRIAAWHLYIMTQIAVEMINSDVSYRIGEAFQETLDKGIVMADVHLNNVGYVNRPGDNDWSPGNPVITDPGHVINLKPAEESAEVPML